MKSPGAQLLPVIDVSGADPQRAVRAGIAHGQLLRDVETALDGLARLQGTIDALEGRPKLENLLNEIRPRVASLSQQLLVMQEELLLKRWPRGIKPRKADA